MTDHDLLYQELQPQLVRILASNLQAADWVLDDACQTAWTSLLDNRDAVAPGSELGWLSTTATRAALRMMRRDRLNEPWEEPPQPALLADVHRISEGGPERDMELRDRLAEVRRLPVRQGRMLMLQGFGYEYEEIAEVTGATRRTVHRELTRARQRLRQIAAGA